MVFGQGGQVTQKGAKTGAGNLSPVFFVRACCRVSGEGLAGATGDVCYAPAPEDSPVILRHQIQWVKFSFTLGPGFGLVIELKYIVECFNPAIVHERREDSVCW